MAPLSEQPLLWLTEPEARVIHLRAEAPDGLVGYAQLDVGSQSLVRAELVVDPDHRRSGVGRSLLARASPRPPRSAEGRCGSGRTATCRRPTRSPTTPAWPVVRELLQMRLDLTARPATEPVLPPGVTVRAFVPGRTRTRGAA